mmetsp:Transcript_23439/g.55219  ORF Transcript_23439/g.55219 Transcript_23439/m.55219 type:complete len:203 (+) Transcript_23439:112-720(+)
MSMIWTWFRSKTTQTAKNISKSSFASPVRPATGTITNKFPTNLWESAFVGTECGSRKAWKISIRPWNRSAPFATGRHHRRRRQKKQKTFGRRSGLPRISAPKLRCSSTIAIGTPSINRTSRTFINVLPRNLTLSRGLFVRYQVMLLQPRTQAVRKEAGRLAEPAAESRHPFKRAYGKRCGKNTYATWPTRIDVLIYWSLGKP